MKLRRHEFVGDPHYAHASTPCTGVLLVNLGTPDAPEPRAVRRYLAQFLADPRVIETPRWLWRLILHGVILRVRPRRSAAAYRKVWTEGGSPLLCNAKRQAEAVGVELAKRANRPVQVRLGMRYGNPSVADALEALRRAGATRLVVLPLYPQYSATTTASTLDAVFEVLQRWRWIPELRCITHYHDHRGYIAALAVSVREAWADVGQPERLLFSFHGIPKRYVLAGDPYFCECQKTARLVAGALGLDDAMWSVSFQSRVGREEWLRPYTDETLKAWGKSGVQRVHVICPGFSADCLETLEEIAVENRDYFTAAGGSTLHYIPALNDRAEHIRALADLLTDPCNRWWRCEQSPETRDGAAKARVGRARALGADA